MNNRLLFAITALVALSVFSASEVLAVKQFEDEFKKMYLPQGNPANPNQKALEAEVQTAKCNVCHVAGKKKTDRNAYGQELGKLLNRKVDAKDPKKIQAALKKVEGMRSQPDDEKSPTFGEKINSGKLPG